MAVTGEALLLSRRVGVKSGLPFALLDFFCPANIPAGGMRRRRTIK